MPIGTLLIFSLFANNVRTADLIGMGEALIDVLAAGVTSLVFEDEEGMQVTWCRF